MRLRWWERPSTTRRALVRERANAGWDADEIAWRDRLWDDRRWELEARWPRGLRVRVTQGELAGLVGTIRSNRVYASDSGAWVDLGGDLGVGVIHWSNLSPEESE